MLVGQQRQHRLFLADHAADEGINQDQKAELGEVGAQAKSWLMFGGAHPPVSSRPTVAWTQSFGPPSSTTTLWCPAASSRLAAPMARSPCPHITTVGSSGTSAARCGMSPSSTCVAPG